MICFALPVYNEVENIKPLLEAIGSAMRGCGESYCVFAVDDGSTDGTADQLEELEAHIPLKTLTHPRNQNLGPTIRDALLMALDQVGPEDVIVTLDADNSHDPAFVPRMAELVNSGKDVVVASRYVAGGREVGLAFYRSLCSRIVNLVLRTLYPIAGLKDYTCGYRAYRAELLLNLRSRYGNRFIEEVGFTCMAELLLKLRPFIRNAAEVPLVLRYDLKRGKSKMKVIPTIFRYARLFLCSYTKSSTASALKSTVR